MFELILIAGLGGLIYFFKDVIDGGGGPNPASDGHVVRTNPWSLPDIDASLQSGSFDRTYDESFEKASNETGVPFALLKAHAIRESALKSDAYHYDDADNGASYGLMQVEWNSSGKNYNRLSQFGYSGDTIKDGSILYDPDISAYLGACIIRDNLNRFNGRIRDAVNAYNTGAAESVRQAPNNYVNDVISYYSQLTGASIV